MGVGGVGGGGGGAGGHDVQFTAGCQLGRCATLLARCLSRKASCTGSDGNCACNADVLPANAAHHHPCARLPAFLRLDIGWQRRAVAVQLALRQVQVMKGVQRHHVHVFQTSGVVRGSWRIATAAAAATSCCRVTAALARRAAQQGRSALQPGGIGGLGSVLDTL